MEKLINIAIKAAIAGGDEILKIYQLDDFGVEIKHDNSPVTLADKASSKAINSYLNQTNIPVLSEEDEHTAFPIRKHWNKLWVVDPLDGTKEFIKKNDEFAVNIALVEDKKPVFGIIYIPTTEELFVGGKTIGAFKFLKKEVELPNFNFKNSTQLPTQVNKNKYIVTGSRSHNSTETEDFVKDLKADHKNIEYVKVGSSIKFCRLAEGKIDLYPRFQLCMEWDTASGHAILQGIGKEVVTIADKTPLVYNKESLYSPFFIAG